MTTEIWEYKTASVYDSSLEILTAELNALGVLGWELVSTAEGGFGIILIFKRPKVWTPQPKPDSYKRTQDGTLRPFISSRSYAELRDDDKFLYNEGVKPEGLV